MRRSIAFLGVSLLLALGGRASAQQFSSTIGAPMSGPSSQGNMSSFFSSTMLGSRPTNPSPLNFQIGNFFPSFSGMQNTMLLQNMFSGPQAFVQNPTGTVGGTQRFQKRKLNGNGTGTGQ